MLPVMAAIPNLFDAAFLIDPILQTPECRGPAVSRSMALNALTRPHVWQSREEALKMIRAPKDSYYQRWAPEVRLRFEEFGLQDISNGRVAVKCDIEQECVGSSYPSAKPAHFQSS